MRQGYDSNTTALPGARTAEVPAAARGRMTLVLMVALALGLGSLAAPRTGLADGSTQTSGFGERVSLAELDQERARFVSSPESPVSLDTFSVILMDELGSQKPGGSIVGDVARSNGAVTVAGPLAN